MSNIIGVLAGQRQEAIGLLSHVDSVAEGPGAGDDALGVAVALETARVVSAQRDRPWSLFVIITDGEEYGLMGAAALVGERDVTDRLRAYINVESIGSGGVPVLFETGPGNGWLTAVWARNAPHPRGGSYAIEIYKRLPNDTDFSILKTQDIPGLNFAAVGDSYAYHTPRDSAARLSPLTIRAMGENAVAIVNALQRVDITQRAAADHTFFDVGGTVAVSYGPAVSTGIAVSALILGLLAWVRVLRESIRTSGFWRWLLVALWTAVAAAVACGTMVGAVWLLRVAREVYHPWYAHPGRLMALLVVTGTAAGWALARAGRLLPARAHGARHPAITWSLTLPLWIALAAGALWFAPAAAYLWTIPLVAAGLLLVLTPPSRDDPGACNIDCRARRGRHTVAARGARADPVRRDGDGPLPHHHAGVHLSRAHRLHRCDGGATAHRSDRSVAPAAPAVDPDDAFCCWRRPSPRDWPTPRRPIHPSGR